MRLSSFRATERPPTVMFRWVHKLTRAGLLVLVMFRGFAGFVFGQLGASLTGAKPSSVRRSVTAGAICDRMYCYAAIEAWSCWIVGWVIADHTGTELVVDALVMVRCQ